METTLKERVFKELILRGHSVRYGKKEWNLSDSKLWFLTPVQIERYFELKNSEEFLPLTKTEKRLIKGNIKDIRLYSKPGAFNLVDIGCGGGEIGLSLLKGLNPVSARYCPLDINLLMIEKAREKFKNEFGKRKSILLKPLENDFMNLKGSLKKLKTKKYPRNILLISRDTLANSEPSGLFHSIKSEMGEEDILIITSSLLKKASYFKRKKFRQKSLGDKFLSNILFPLGLKEEDIKLKRRVIKGRVEIYYKILKNITIKYKGNHIDLRKRDKIIVLTSYKHTQDEFKTYLHAQFTTVVVNVNKEKTQAIAICQK